MRHDEFCSLCLAKYFGILQNILFRCVVLKCHVISTEYSSRKSFAHVMVKLRIYLIYCLLNV